MRFLQQLFRRAAEMSGRVPKPRPRRRWILAGNPAYFRCQKKLKRRLAGLEKPVKCPTCRMPTRQRTFKIEGPPAHYCLCCGSVFTRDTLLVWHPRKGIVARRKTIPPSWRAPLSFISLLK